MATHLRTGSDYDEAAACGNETEPTTANIDAVDCQECADIWDDWCELNDNAADDA